ncbi:MAG TPA: molybdate ABC transporter permease subunit [Cyclobacteriaceae bacterium]
MIDLSPLWLTLKLAISTSLILFFIAIPLASWLSNKKNFLGIIVQAIVSLPLILPPTVLGFYMLLAFSPANALGRLLENWFDLRVVFSFSGLLIASVIYNLPFMVHPILSGLSTLPNSFREAAYSLGKTRTQTLLKVLLPNIKSSLLTGLVLTFAHAVGEFGVVLMIGGNIPGKTRTASIAIYDEVELFHYDNANIYAGILLVSSFIILVSLYSFRSKKQPFNYY